MKLRTIAIITGVVLLAGCATAPLAVEGTRGFFWGLIDGGVAPFSFIISLFSSEVGIYGVPNSGGWYDFGFLIGLTFWAGGGYAAKKKR